MLEWTADYGNTSLPQYNEDGTENKYSDIDRQSLKRFILIDEDKVVRFVLHVDPGKRLIYRRRTAIDVMSRVKNTVYIIGYQENIQGYNKQAINFYFEESGHIETMDRFKEGTEWFYPVIFLPEETIC